MTNEKYLTAVSSPETYIDFKIKWNISAISGEKSQTGFIIQHMHIDSHIDCVPGCDYWEAWHVTNGPIEQDNGSYDDNWSPLPSFLIEDFRDEINASDGIIKYCSEVYWIPQDSDIYAVVSTWQREVVGHAGNLRMTHQFSCDVEQYFVCNRYHEWNYKKYLKSEKR